jgi:hypothetical protein
VTTTDAPALGSHAPARAMPARRGTPGFWPAMALLMIVWAARASVGFNIDLAVDPAYRAIYSNVVKFALWVVPAVAFALWMRRDSPVRALRLGPPSARALPLCAAVIAVYLAGVAFDTARKHGVPLSGLAAPPRCRPRSRKKRCSAAWSSPSCPSAGASGRPTR